MLVEAFGVVVEEKDMLELMKMSKHNFSRSRLMHHPDFAGDKSSKRNDERSVKAKDNEITKGKKHCQNKRQTLTILFQQKVLRNFFGRGENYSP